MKRILAGLMGVALAASATSATDPIAIQIGQRSASVFIQLPPNLSVDFSLAFEQVSGLTEQSIGLSAGFVDPTNAALLARLPQGASIPAAFPVLIAVEPPSIGPLSFTGVVAISLLTPNLVWTPGTPLRLFAAPLGGEFVDITSGTSAGSYRAGASKGGFSEFLVVSDLRAVDTVIAQKFDRLQSKLNQYALAIPASIKADLQARLEAARSSYVAGNPQHAALTIDGFAATVQQHGDTEIPNIWRASRDVTNIAGELRSGAATLSYSLGLKASSGS